MSLIETRRVSKESVGRFRQVELGMVKIRVAHPPLLIAYLIG
jgi:hypothetical protein